MYIDPNTGGMLFQILAALLAVFSGFALLFSGKIRAYIASLRRSRREKNAPESLEAEPQPADDSGPTQGGGSAS